MGGYKLSEKGLSQLNSSGGAKGIKHSQPSGNADTGKSARRRKKLGCPGSEGVPRGEKTRGTKPLTERGGEKKKNRKTKKEASHVWEGKV